jgi:hypothetical protein
MTAEVEDIDDEDESPTEDEIEECLAAYQRVVSAAEADLEELDFDADSIAYQIAARVDFGTEVKQGLLELRSERERVLAWRRCSTRPRRPCSATARSANEPR